MLERQVIRVLLIDDSPLSLELLKRILVYPDGGVPIEVVGQASNGLEGLEQARRHEPDIICCDLHMPVMDGIEFVKRIMVEKPTPVLVVSVSAKKSYSRNIFEMLSAGAVDLQEKPDQAFSLESSESSTLRRKVRLISQVDVFRARTSSVLSQPSSSERVVLPEPVWDNKRRTGYQMVVIGGSTGAPIALAAIFSVLDQNYPLPILCAQHIGDGFTHSLVSWLNSLNQLDVMETSGGVVPRPGTAYFPPDGHNLYVDKDGVIQIERAAQNGNIPSVDRLFISVSEAYGESSVGVLLSGMGNDGARGLEQIHRRGGYTIVQDRQSSVVFGMPGEAQQLFPVDCVSGREEIGRVLLGLSSVVPKASTGECA